MHQRNPDVFKHTLVEKRLIADLILMGPRAICYPMKEPNLMLLIT